jgi:peptidoglycan/LPS O-acetylase OafA/YrhL
MGTVRFLLSLLVVGSHFGGLDGIAGGTAVAAFFVISGFLMARTITENYASLSGARRFYLNRCVRILPAFVVILVLTFILLYSREGRPFQITPEGTMYMPDSDMPTSIGQVVQVNLRGFPNFMFASVYLAPQAWSLVVEAGFYLAAPFLVLLWRRGYVPALYALAATSVWLAASSEGHAWIRSSVSALWIFILGVLAYAHTASVTLGPTARVVAKVAAVIPLLIVGALGLDMTPLSDRAILFLIPFVVTAWLILGQWGSRTASTLDRALGNYAYGVFIGHFYAVFVMLWLSETVYRTTGIFGIIGVPDVSQLRLRTNLYLFPIAMGVAIYYGLERPFERLRAALRRPSVSQPTDFVVAPGVDVRRPA